MNPINIARPFYTMATKDGTKAEISLYGEIVEQQPTDFWGDPIKGEFIIGSEFLEDLKQVEGCSEITIRMNSKGGDCGTSIMIHNRLRELAAKGTKLVCIVDAMAMSGGSLIMCACDTVKVNPSSLIMIHKCWSLLIGPYNADELRSMAKASDAYDEAQASIYERKTKLSKTQILHMMADATYMSGKEATEKGFADEVLDEEPLKLAASADGRIIYVGERAVQLAPGQFAPDFIPTVEAGAVPVNTNKNAKEGGKPMANTIEELRAENPELVSQLESAARADAVQQEQARLQEIEKVAGLFNADLVNAAKYGDKACDAKELSYRAALEAAEKGQQFLNNMAADHAASNAAAVPAVPAPADDPESQADAAKTPGEKLKAAREAIKSLHKEDK